MFTQILEAEKGGKKFEFTSLSTKGKGLHLHFNQQDFYKSVHKNSLRSPHFPSRVALIFNHPFYPKPLLQRKLIPSFPKPNREKDILTFLPASPAPSALSPTHFSESFISFGLSQSSDSWAASLKSCVLKGILQHPEPLLPPGFRNTAESAQKNVLSTNRNVHEERLWDKLQGTVLFPPPLSVALWRCQDLGAEGREWAAKSVFFFQTQAFRLSKSLIWGEIGRKDEWGKN